MDLPNDHPAPARPDAVSTAPTSRPWSHRLRAVASGMVFAFAGSLDGLANQRAHHPPSATPTPQPDHANSGSSGHDQRGQASGAHRGQTHHHHHAHGHGSQDGASGQGGHDGNGGTGGAGRNLFDSPLATKARRMAHHEQAGGAANANAGAGQGAAASHAAGSAQTGHVSVTVPTPANTVIPMPGGAPPIVIGPDGFLVNPATGNAAGGAPSAPLS